MEHPPFFLWRKIPMGCGDFRFQKKNGTPDLQQNPHGFFGCFCSANPTTKFDVFFFSWFLMYTDVYWLVLTGTMEWIIYDFPETVGNVILGGTVGIPPTRYILSIKHWKCPP